MKKILLFALLSFAINASTVVIDLGRIENEVNAIFPDSKAQNSFWKNDWSKDVEAWRKEIRIDLVLGNNPYYVVDNPFPCLAFSTDADATQELIDWLKKKYL